MEPKVHCRCFLRLTFGALNVFRIRSRRGMNVSWCLGKQYSIDLWIWELAVCLYIGCFFTAGFQESFQSPLSVSFICPKSFLYLSHDAPSSEGCHFMISFYYHGSAPLVVNTVVLSPTNQTVTFWHLYMPSPPPPPAKRCSTPRGTDWLTVNRNVTLDSDTLNVATVMFAETPWNPYS